MHPFVVLGGGGGQGGKPLDPIPFVSQTHCMRSSTVLYIMRLCRLSDAVFVVVGRSAAGAFYSIRTPCADKRC